MKAKRGSTKTQVGRNLSRHKKQWQLKLYVARQSAKSLLALANLKEICETRLKGDYHIEVIDVLKKPQLAKSDQILAVPTLIRALPEPIRRITGDLSNTEHVLVRLDLTAR